MGGSNTQSIEDLYLECVDCKSHIKLSEAENHREGRRCPNCGITVLWTRENVLEYDKLVVKVNSHSICYGQASKILKEEE